MATGPEHYRAAERLIEAFQGLDVTSRDALAAAHTCMVEAQVHATLALAAATALSSRERDGEHDPHGMDPRDRREWEKAAGGPA